VTASAPQEALCCGQGGAWSKAGGPLLPGCQLCVNSPTYWRRDGRESVPPEESYRSVPDLET
jgi:hypothetical protein